MLRPDPAPRPPWKTLAAIILLGVIIYVNSIGGRFIWDDKSLVRDNVTITKLSNIPGMFGQNIMAGVGRKSGFYRPLQIITYALDYSIWRLNEKGYHLTNIFLHILTALAVYWLATILFSNRILSFFTTVLYVSHPVHTEAVAYISGRADPLAALFIILTVIFYIRSYRSQGNAGFFLLFILSYALALLSKEYSLITPLLIFVYHFAFREKIFVKGFAATMVMALAYLFLRATILRFPSAHDIIPRTFLQNIAGFLVAIFEYARLLIIPSNLHMEYGNPVFRFADPKAAMGLIIIIISITIAFKYRGRNPLVPFSIGWFFLAILPVSNIYPINAYMAEHWLYIPSIGFFLAFGNVLYSVYERKGLKEFTIIVFMLVAAFYSWTTIRQNDYWREPISFYERTLRYSTDSVRVLNELGIEYDRNGQSEKAVVLFERAISLKPDYFYAYGGMANAYVHMGRMEDAIRNYKRMIELEPNDAGIYNNLANVYSFENKHEEAIVYYRKSLELNPTSLAALTNLANALSCVGKNEEAIGCCKKALEINPNVAEAYNNLGNALKNLGRTKEAIEQYQRALAIKPGLAAAYINLARAYYEGKDYGLARKYYEAGLRLGNKPDAVFQRSIEAVGGTYSPSQN